MKTFMFIVVCVITSVAIGQTDRFFDAMRQVESSGNDNLVGDNGKAIGPLQIHRVYWKDALEYDPSIGGSYEDCYDFEYAKKVVRAYMRRYAPKNASDEEMARIHNGGPRGHRKSSTLKYWTKFKRQLK